MPAVESLGDLKAVNEQLKALKGEYPEVCAHFVESFRKNRKIGYKNVCKMKLENTTPEKLKGLEKRGGTGNVPEPLLYYPPFFLLHKDYLRASRQKK